jgi:tryptophan synthase beta chain
MSQVEGIIPAIETSHAIAYALKFVPTLSKDEVVIINISGRGDKDVEAIENYVKATGIPLKSELHN